jgi:hypothetical protein
MKMVENEEDFRQTSSGSTGAHEACKMRPRGTSGDYKNETSGRLEASTKNCECIIE